MDSRQRRSAVLAVCGEGGEKPKLSWNIVSPAAGLYMCDGDAGDDRPTPPLGNRPLPTATNRPAQGDRTKNREAILFTPHDIFTLFFLVFDTCLYIFYGK